MKKVLFLLLASTLLLSGCGKSNKLQTEIDLLYTQLEDGNAALGEAQAELDECREQLSHAQAELESAKAQLAAEPEMDFGECCRMVYDAHSQRIDELMLYDFLSMDVDEIFSDYDGSGKQCISYIGAAVVRPVTNSVYYWKASNEFTAPEDAALELVTMMLEEIKAYPDKSFTLMDYEVRDMELCDRYDLLREDMRLVWDGAMAAAEYKGTDVRLDQVEDFIKQLFPVRMDNGSYALRSDSLAIALGDDMWIFTPQFSYSFTGTSAGEGNSLVENGKAVDIHFGDTYDQYYILIKNGDVWRMQSYNGIKVLDDALKNR